MYKNDGYVRRYSESFKLKVLAELAKGNHSKRQIALTYGVQSSTINEWIRKYDRKDLMNTRVTVQTDDEISRIKALQKELKQLKDLLIKKDLEKLVMESYLEVAAENPGVQRCRRTKKKLKHRALMKSAPKNRKDRQFNIGTICDAFSLKRDAYYKFHKRYLAEKEVERAVVGLVRQSRKVLPREGTRKLLKSLHDDFQEQRLKIGRDRLFRILRENGLLVARKKYSSRTTNSYHRFYKYNNIIKDLKIDRPDQVWASDITYIRTLGGFCYLALITDMYSRKIVGYDLSDSLELNGCLRALQKAIYQAKATKGLIHHSDRGIQYCSNQYTQVLKRKKMQISMTEENHCYENAMAERVNGILKDEFYLDQTFASVDQAKEATKNAIKLYNNKRLHLSLDFRTPNYVHHNAA